MRCMRDNKSNTDGKNLQIYRALAQVPSELFRICVVGTTGEIHSVGNAEHEFSVMSVSKPFVVALVYQGHSPGKPVGGTPMRSVRPLIVTSGLGWAQGWGGPVEEIRPGDASGSSPARSIGMEPRAYGDDADRILEALNGTAATPPPGTTS
jgi:hypothetical protein